MSFDNDDTNEAHERRIVRCLEQSCRARIVYLRNRRTGRNVPVDADTVEVDDHEYDGERHISHFKTCTKPARFSKSSSRPSSRERGRVEK